MTVRAAAFTAVALGALLSASAALPAAAATAESDVDAVEVVDITIENFGDSFPALISAGDVEFPITFGLPSAEFAASGFLVPTGTDPACSRTVSSVTVDLGFDASQALRSYDILLNVTGDVPYPTDATLTYEGPGTAEIVTDFIKLEVPVLAESAEASLTIVLSEPLPVPEAFLLFGLFGDDGVANTTLSGVSFAVTDTCADPAPQLAATGADSSVALAIGGAALGAGILVAGAAAIAARRRTT